jgi:hypothetical protein
MKLSFWRDFEKAYVGDSVVSATVVLRVRVWGKSMVGIEMVC